MQEQTTLRCGRAHVGHRAALEGIAFVCALALVVVTAIMAKERNTGAAPMLAMIESVRAVATPVSDTPAPNIAPAARTEAPVGGAVVKPDGRIVDADGKVIGHTDPNVRFFKGRLVRPVRTLNMTVTAYSPDHRSCGKWADGVTASNRSVWTNGMRLVAADTRVLPFGSLITVPGYADDEIVPVLDRGGAIKGMRLDVLYPTHEIALQWGVQKLPITVWEYVD